MLSPRVAVGIADRLSEARDPEALRRKGLLDSCIVLVFVMHMLGLLGFIRLQEWEGACVRVIRDVGVAFELTPPPVNEIVSVQLIRPPILVEGDSVRLKAPSGKPAVREGASPESTVVKPAPPRILAPAEIRAAQRAARTTPAAPRAVTPVNIIKAPPIAAPVREQIVMALTANTTAGGIVGPEDDAGVGPMASTGIEGGNSGAEPKISTVLPPGGAGLNIRPYREDLEKRIASNWHPTGAVGNLTALLRIAKDGTLIDVQLLRSSGKKRLDRQVLEAIRSTEFAPLPKAYQGKALTFKIDFASVVGIGEH